MTTRDMDKSSGTKATKHERGASLSGWIGVAAVTLGTFTLVTNEFIPVGLLTNIAKDMHVSIGVAGTTVTMPGLVAAAAAPLITVPVGQLDRRIADERRLHRGRCARRVRPEHRGAAAGPIRAGSGHRRFLGDRRE
jgi:hypothetical protein